jgi:hypothetical protein
MCIAVGLYVHRSFHRSGWSDGQHNTCRSSTPKDVWRQAPVNLNLLSCDSRLTHCSVVKEPGSPRTAQGCPQLASKFTLALRERFRPKSAGNETVTNSVS